MRNASIKRETKETSVKVTLNLDGSSRYAIATGIGFFDHVLEQLASKSGFDLEVKAKGDLQTGEHHMVEDVGIALGKAFKKALGDKRGIERYGYSFAPMDECLARAVVDVSGRSFLVWNVSFSRERVADLDAESVEQFFQSLAFNADLTLNVCLLDDGNTHHAVEAVFKAVGRALRDACRVTGNEIPSTKGVIE